MAAGPGIRIGIVGLGKIARDAHVPALAASSAFTLTGTADPVAGLPDTPHFPDIAALLSDSEPPEALAICTPPQLRAGLARYALERGRHILLEKPPGTTVGEIAALRRLAAARGCTIFCAWHSQFGAGIAPARQWLSSRRVRSVEVEWHEDVRVWHPGQRWIWETGGFGVFDPGINALSVLTAILPSTPYIESATLHYPINCATPIAAQLKLSDSESTDIRASFDFLTPGAPTWTIRIVAEDGSLRLTDGGARLFIGERAVELEASEEYRFVYERFADLISAGRSDADLLPLELVADALLCARHVDAPAFVDDTSH